METQANTKRVGDKPELWRVPLHACARTVRPAVLGFLFVIITVAARKSSAAENETPVARTVLCVYGFAPGDPARSPVWPPDIYSAQMLQMALEGMGYRMEFHDAGKGCPPKKLPFRFAR